MSAYTLAIFCVLGMSAGQILFKLSAESLTQSGTVFAFKTASTLLVALAIYGITAVAWVWILQKIDLGRVYPIMAFTFIMVPVFSYIFFGERISFNTLAGSGLIIAGVWLSIYQ